MNWNLLHLILQKNIGSEDTVLDIGCGNKGYSMYGRCTTLDAWQHVSPDICIDLQTNDLPFSDNSFDYVIMYDVIEHIQHKRGQEILEQVKRICRKKIFLFTPSYFFNNAENTQNTACWAYNCPFNYHKSLWSVEDFKDWQLIVPPDESIFCQYICTDS